LLCTCTGFYSSSTSFLWADHEGTGDQVSLDKAGYTINLVYFSSYSCSHQYGSKGDSGSYKEARSCQRVFDKNPTFWGSV
jgi:hypothetical protein